MPNRLASLACGIRKVRVAARGAPARAKLALSHVVAAMFGLAGTGRVPTQGLLILPITGRSAAARVPRVSPEGGGSTGADAHRRGARSRRVGRAHVAYGVGQRAHGALDGDGSLAERLRDRRDGQGARARQAHDVGAAYLVGDAQLEHLRLVAETLHAVGVEQLDPRLAAAGEPAERRAVGRAARPRRSGRSRPSAPPGAGCSAGRSSRTCAPSSPARAGRRTGSPGRPS